MSKPKALSKDGRWAPARQPWGLWGRRAGGWQRVVGWRVRAPGALALSSASNQPPSIIPAMSRPAFARTANIYLGIPSL